jgi:hypothetical protein
MSSAKINNGTKTMKIKNVKKCIGGQLTNNNKPFNIARRSNLLRKTNRNTIKDIINIVRININ